MERELQLYSAEVRGSLLSVSSRPFQVPAFHLSWSPCSCRRRATGRAAAPSATFPPGPLLAESTKSLRFPSYYPEMHPPLTLHRHPMCAEIIEEFQKCHLDHPVKKFFGECTDLKIKLDRCFRQEKALKRKANFEESKKFKEQLQAYKREMAEKNEA